MGEKSHKYYYVEKDNNVIHLLFINDYCDLASYYNTPVVSFLKQKIISQNNRTLFSVVDECKKYFVKEINADFLEKEIQLEDFSDEEDKIKLKEKKISFRKIFVDDIDKKKIYVPYYNYYVEKNDLIINVELPGKDADIKSKINKDNECYIFIFKGSKPGYKIDAKEQTSISGGLKGPMNFEFNIRIPLKDIIIEKNEKGKINWYEKTNVDGVYTFKYHIAETLFDDFD